MLEVNESPAAAAVDRADTAAPADRRFFWAALLGSLVALALNVWMLAGPQPTLIRDGGLLGSFFDVQGRALLHGHLDVNPALVSIEGFRVDGHTYTYFGLVPALLRLPVLLVTHSLDGRLTQLSMLVAFVVLLAAAAQLHWRVRREVRPDQPVGRADVAAAFLLQVALGAGAIPLFLASQPVVYHEAELWGAALSLAALAAVVGVVARPTATRIAAAGLLAALAVNTRFSVGLGPILALAVLAAGLAARLLATRPAGRAAEAIASFGPKGHYDRAGRTLALLVAAVVVPLAIAGAINAAKFGRPFGIPIQKQVASQVEPNRVAALAANGGTIFGLKFVPTTLVQAARPDAVGTTRAFPFIGLPHGLAHVFGHLRFDTIEPSLSALTSMPELCLLTVIGLVAVARRRRLWPLLGVLAASAGGFVVTLTIAFVTTRYLADFFPFLALGAAVGLQALLLRRRRLRRALGGVAALTLIAVAVNGAVGLVGQRLLSPDATEAERAAFVRFQDDVDRLLGRRPTGVFAGDRLPETALGAPGDLFVLDRCAGLYVHGLDGGWLPVERTDRSGVYRLRVRFPGSGRPQPQALLALGSGSRGVVVTSRRSAAGTVVGLLVGGRPVATSRPVAVSSGADVPVVVSIDPVSGNHGAGPWYTTVRVNGDRVVYGPTPYDRLARAVLGADPGALPRFSGSVTLLAAPPTACRRVAGRSGLLATRLPRPLAAHLRRVGEGRA